MRHLRALRAWAVVAGASAGFAVLAGIITWAAASQRRDAWVAAAPRMYAERVAALARLRLRVPDMTSDLNLRALTNSVPAPAHVLGPLGAHVLVQTMFFAAVCALMVMLNLAGRPLWAALAPVATIVGVVITAGPLAFVPSTLAGPLTPSSVPGYSFVYFAAPLWWRVIVAAVMAVPFAGAWFLTRRPQQRQPMVVGKTLGALALFGLVVELAALTWPQTLVPDGALASDLLPTAAVLIVLGCCLAVAGSGGTLRRGAVTAVTVALAGGAVWTAAWTTYRSGNVIAVSGWQSDSGQPTLWLGTWQLIALVLAAGGLGSAAGVARQVLAARRPNALTIFGHPESPSLP